MSISKKWQRRAWETWREIPPRKTVRRRSHLKFSQTVRGCVSIDLRIWLGLGRELTGSKERTLRETVAENSERDVAHRAEDDDEREVDFEGIEVVVIEVAIEPADEEVVNQGEDPSCTNGIVCSNISKDGDF
jgi:hypothetical protein